MRGEQKKMKKYAESLEAVHTHTHTHTPCILPNASFSKIC